MVFFLLNADRGGRDSFYECRAFPQVLAIEFLRPKSWLIPVNIAILSGCKIMQVPLTIKIFEVTYNRAGITVNSSSHFTAAIPWVNKFLYHVLYQSMKIDSF